jgi:hypothetical protein
MNWYDPDSTPKTVCPPSQPSGSTPRAPAAGRPPSVTLSGVSHGMKTRARVLAGILTVRVKRSPSTRHWLSIRPWIESYRAPAW